MANIDNAFAAEKISLNDDILVATGTNNPTSTGYEAPIGSIFLRSGAQPGIYIKTGANDTDWQTASMTPRQAMSLVALRT